VATNASPDQRSPYEVLKPYGIGPNSSMKEIDMCTFQVMKHKRLEEAGPELEAIQKLKQIPERLAIDFFLPAASSWSQNEVRLTPEELVAQIPPVTLPSIQEILTQFGLSPEQVVGREVEADINQLRQELAAHQGDDQTIEFRAQVTIQDFLEELFANENAASSSASK